MGQHGGICWPFIKDANSGACFKSMSPATSLLACDTLSASKSQTKVQMHARSASLYTIKPFLCSRRLMELIMQNIIRQIWHQKTEFRKQDNCPLVVLDTWVLFVWECRSTRLELEDSCRMKEQSVCSSAERHLAGWSRKIRHWHAPLRAIMKWENAEWKGAKSLRTQSQTASLRIRTEQSRWISYHARVGAKTGS